MGSVRTNLGQSFRQNRGLTYEEQRAGYFDTKIGMKMKRLELSEQSGDCHNSPLYTADCRDVLRRGKSDAITHIAILMARHRSVGTALFSVVGQGHMPRPQQISEACCALPLRNCCEQSLA